VLGRRIRQVVAAIISTLIIALLASQAAQATPSAPITVSNAGPSGIGLALNRTGAGTLANAPYYQRALKSSLWVRTPAGLVFHSCSYSVPNGSKVDSIHGQITLPDGRSLPVKPCAYPRLILPGTQHALTPMASNAQPATTSGWMQGFQEDGLAPLGYLTVEYAAPSAPTQGTPEDIQWSALASDANGDSLLQPLVAWGGVGTIRNGTPTSNSSGDFLSMAAYYFWSGNAVAATFVKVNAADTLTVVVSASGCNSGGGGCTWLLYIGDGNTGQQSVFTVVSSPAYTTVIGGMFESYGASNCNMLFANHHLVFRDLAVDKLVPPGGATPMTPQFHKNVRDQECGMNTTYSTSGGDITWTP